MNNPNNTPNYGLIIEKTEIDHYVFGASPMVQDVLQADGQWDNFIPVYEPQFGDGWDTFGCVVWGNLNAIEILWKKIYGEDANFSERFTYDLVPVRPPGSDPHVVCESIRSQGLINNDLLPMTQSYEEFTRSIPYNLIVKGREWHNAFEFGHEWLFSRDIQVSNKQKTMMEALKMSPLGVSVTAWHESNGIYSDMGEPNNHWCVAFGYVEGEYWKIFDSYDQTIKHLDWFYNFECAKRYRIVKKPIAKNWWSDIINFIKNLWQK